jgi:hypothetical protein
MSKKKIFIDFDRLLNISNGSEQNELLKPRLFTKGFSKRLSSSYSRKRNEHTQPFRHNRIEKDRTKIVRPE